MPLSITIPGASFSKYVDRSVPYLAEAKGYHLFGGDDATSRLNLVPGSTASLTASAIPTYGANYVELDGTHYLTSPYTLTGNQTLIAVATEDAQYGFYASTYHNSGLGLVHEVPGVLRGSMQGANSYATLANGPEFAFLAATWSGASVRVFAGSAGALIAGDPAAQTNGAASSSVIYGPASNFGGAAPGHRQAAAMAFDRDLSQAELLELYSYFRFKMPKRGIAVV